MIYLYTYLAIPGYRDLVPLSGEVPQDDQKPQKPGSSPDEGSLEGGEQPDEKVPSSRSGASEKGSLEAPEQETSPDQDTDDAGDSKGFNHNSYKARRDSRFEAKCLKHSAFD